jgi:hypothetical protein
VTRCADCGRALLNPPALVIGRHAFGPVCAKRYIVAPTRLLVPVPMRRQVARPAEADPAQIALFDWAAA